ncbi:MAG: hypothetical protein ACQEQX_05410 [Thermodesulfobacteriota bacterium]
MDTKELFPCLVFEIWKLEFVSDFDIRISNLSGWLIRPGEKIRADSPALINIRLRTPAEKKGDVETTVAGMYGMLHKPDQEPVTVEAIKLRVQKQFLHSHLGRRFFRKIGAD